MEQEPTPGMQSRTVSHLVQTTIKHSEQKITADPEIDCHIMFGCDMWHYGQNVPVAY